MASEAQSLDFKGFFNILNNKSEGLRRVFMSWNVEKYVQKLRKRASFGLFQWVENKVEKQGYF